MSHIILVVDDSDIIVEVMCELLEYLGHHALPAYCRREALELARTNTVDVAFVDLRLGNEDGLEVREALAKAGIARERIVIITGYSVEDVRHTDARVYTKPFGMEKIEECLRDLFAKTA